MSWPIAGGGVTVMWDYSNPGDGHGSGAIRQYHLPQARAAVLAEWQQAFLNGQRRIAICTEYFEGGTSFHLDSSDGLCVQDKANLKAAFADAKAIGFDHVMIETGPAWSADPNNWQNPTVMGAVDKPRPFEPESYGRNFKIVMDQCEVAAASGIPDWGVDSHTEAFHAGALDPLYLAYLRRWWSDIQAEMGDAHNPGMSCADIGNSDLPSLVANFALVYQDKLPVIWLPHAYRNLSTQWPAFQAELNKQGLGGRGFLVGERYCDDPSILDSDPNIFWSYAWPVGTNTPDGSVQDRYANSYIGPLPN
jgi:hypothetical protein